MAKDSDLPALPKDANPLPQIPPPSGKGIFKRFTTRIRSSSASNPSGQPTASSSRTPPAAAAPTTTEPSKRRKPTLKLPSLPTLPKPQAPPLPVNAFTSPELRQAALRERGLLPDVPKPYRDQHGYMIPLSEQEAEFDRRRSVLAQEPGRDSVEEDVETEAKKIREAWLRKNSLEDLAAPPAPGELQQQQDLHLHRGKGSISASERAFALAATDDSMVIGTQQSPRLGTFVQSPVHEVAVVVNVDLPEPQNPELERGTLSTQDSPIPAVDLTGNMTSMVEPHEVPLPASPTSMRTQRTSGVSGEEPEGVVIEEEGVKPAPASPDSVQKVAQWLQTSPSHEYPTAPSPLSSTAPKSPRALPQSPESKPLPMIIEDVAQTSSPSLVPPTSPVLRPPASAKSRPSPITVISTSQSAPNTAIPLVLEASPPLDFEDPRSPRSASLPILSISPPPTPSAAATTPTPTPRTATPTRGRSMTVVTSDVGAISLAPSTSTGSGSSSRIPALSPTRTTSSSITNSEVPPTPTGTGFSSFARPRKSSVVSDDSAESPVRRRRKKTVGDGDGGLKIHTGAEDGLLSLGVDVKTVEAIVESPVSVEVVVVDSPVDVEDAASEYGTAEQEQGGDEKKEDAVPLPSPRARLGVQRAKTETQERRKSISFGLFGKGSGAPGSDATVSKTSQPRPIRSMSNLRRSVAGTISSKLRPKSTLVVNTSSKVDVSRLPPSPSLSRAPSPMPGSRSQTPAAYSPSMNANGRGQREGSRPRQPLSPTVHSRGTILLSTGKIEDDESRRLSEMAFLDF